MMPKFRDIDPDHEGVHVMGSGGAPQTELDDPDLCHRGRLKPYQRTRWWWRAYCPNCRGEHSATFRMAPHEPSPPTIDQCPHCGRPYPELAKGEKSYTDPPCRECAMAHDERDREAAGFVPTPSEQEAG